MPSQRTVIWAGAAAALVVAGAGAGALVWTHSDVARPVSGSTQIEAPVPEPSTPATPAAQSATQSAAPPAARNAGPPPAQTAVLARGADAPANAAAPSGVKPAFDVVSVVPTGEAVIAGRAAPNAKVELRDGDKTLAEATADASGQFVIIPPPLAPGGHSLSLASGEGKTEPETSNVVAVSVPPPEAPKAAAALTKPIPTAPSPPAVTMRTLATSPAAGGSRVTIQSVEGDGQGGLVTRGSAEPNSLVRLYLNGADIADAETKSDGRWSLTIKHGVGPGAYSVRAEEVNRGGATVVASAEIRFDYPAGAPGGAPPPGLPAPIAASASQSSGSSPADVIMDSIQTAQVVTGHTLWALSQNYYGDPMRYPLIYEANKAQIHNPNLIYPGQVFVVPKSETKP